MAQSILVLHQVFTVTLLGSLRALQLSKDSKMDHKIFIILAKIWTTLTYAAY